VKVADQKEQRAEKKAQKRAERQAEGKSKVDSLLHRDRDNGDSETPPE
jgi:hypothetical protein